MQAPQYNVQQPFVPGPMQQSLAAPEAGVSAGLQRPVRRPVTIHAPLPQQPGMLHSVPGQPQLAFPDQYSQIVQQAPALQPDPAQAPQQHHPQQPLGPALGVPAADGARRTGVRRYSAIAGQM